MRVISSIVVGISIVAAAYLLAQSIVHFKMLDRTVVVKGLAEKEINADIVIWPITYTQATNDLAELYAKLESDTQKIKSFLIEEGFTEYEISLSSPTVIDKVAQDYGNPNQIKFRYNGSQTLSLYSSKVDKARKSMITLTKLGKKGIAFRQNDYQNKVEFLFTNLNAIKPEMIRQATANAREAATQFAIDSSSTLGKIRSAKQGQFSISNRDSNTPYIKTIRVVSTVEYYLSD